MEDISIIIPHRHNQSLNDDSSSHLYSYEKYVIYDPHINDCDEWKSAMFHSLSSEQILDDILYRQECLKTHIKFGIASRDFSRKFQKYWNALKDTLTLGIKSYRNTKMVDTYKTQIERDVLSKIGRMSESIEYFTDLYFHTKRIWTE